MTVGELRVKLKDVPDDLLIVSDSLDIFTGGIQEAHFSCRVMRCKEKTEYFHNPLKNALDPKKALEPYTAYEEDVDGDKEVFYM